MSVLQDFASGPTEQPKPVRYPKQDDPAYKEWFLCSEAQTEAPVMNRNYYIGFIDVMIKYVTGGWSTSWGRGPDEVHKCNREYLVIVEVKVSKVDPADIIKQMKLYATYAINSLPEYDVRRHRFSFVVATCYPVSQSTKDMFAREGIKHIFLGAGFEAYCAARRAEKPVTEEGL